MVQTLVTESEDTLNELSSVVQSTRGHLGGGGGVGWERNITGGGGGEE